MILVGELAPGQRVTQDGLSELVGVSTMPVRESLLRLAAEGFIEALPTRSFRVVELSHDDLVDVYWAQSTLSGELTRRACLRDDRDLLDALRACQQTLESAHERGALDEMESQNWRFHRLIYLAADASRLLLLLKMTLRYTPFGLYSRIGSWADETVRGHREILAAFVDGDSEQAAVTASAHVMAAGELLFDNYASKGYWTPPEQ